MTRSTARRRGRDKHFKRGLKTALAVFAMLALMLITGSGFFGGHHGAANPGWQVPDIPASSENPDTQGGDEDAETTGAPDDPGVTEPPAETKAPESGEEDSPALRSVLCVQEIKLSWDSFPEGQRLKPRSFLFRYCLEEAPDPHSHTAFSSGFLRRLPAFY